MLCYDTVSLKNALRKGIVPTNISTTKIAMLHNELPRERRFVNDSWPGVSMIRRPGIL